MKAAPLVAIELWFWWGLQHRLGKSQQILSLFRFAVEALPPLNLPVIAIGFNFVLPASFLSFFFFFPLLFYQSQPVQIYILQR